ncbi:related to allantoate permease [Phialocephala subalpina]|uniref:Related to allantoate permease n=1 Tax=Phialocephala subalpina TaxID=576137 RepID=A0A1L7XC57_9HELO|nr:related to allantoate permease [Phialocephala subalpina]
MRNWEEDEISPTLSKSSTKTRSETKSETQVETKQELSQPPVRGLTRSPRMTDIRAHGGDIEDSKEVAASTDESIPALVTIWDEARVKQLRLKLDLRLLPYLWLIYMFCFLDRTNIGNARLFELEKDLGMKGLDYNVASSILFPPYALAEIPANIILKRMHPGLWFTIIMITWSTLTIITGFVKNYPGLLTCRVFLGLAEGDLFPGVCFYITSWYPRNETGLRMALFFSASPIAGAVGGFLARGIGMMNGVGYRDAWSWVFILEGAATFVVSLGCLFFISDYPDKAKFLTEEEKSEVKRRLAAENDLSNAFSWQYVRDALTDWKIWAIALVSMMLFTGLYSISLFLPTILKDLGYSTNKTQLMTVPVYLVAATFTIAVSYTADRVNQRGIFMLGAELVSIIGFLMLIISKSAAVQYAGTFFAAAGIYSLVPLIGAWNSNNIGGSTKRAVGIAMQVGCGNLGGTIAGFIYLPKNAPRFHTGHSILLSLTLAAFCITLAMTVYYRRENAQRARLLELGSFTPEMLKAQEEELGDKAITFKYTI